MKEIPTDIMYNMILGNWSSFKLTLLNSKKKATNWLWLQSFDISWRDQSPSSSRHTLADREQTTILLTWILPLMTVSIRTYHTLQRITGDKTFKGCSPRLLWCAVALPLSGHSFMDRQGYLPAFFGVHMCDLLIPLLNSALLLKYLPFCKNKSSLFPEAIWYLWNKI